MVDKEMDKPGVVNKRRKLDLGERFDTIYNCLNLDIAYTSYVSGSRESIFNINTSEQTISGRITGNSLAKIDLLSYRRAIKLRRRVSKGMAMIAFEESIGCDDVELDYPAFIGSGESKDGLIYFMVRDPAMPGIMTSYRMAGNDDVLVLESRGIASEAELKIIMGGVAGLLSGL